MDCSRLAVYFNHGKESGPWGSKIQRLAAAARELDCRVESLDYQGIYDPQSRVDKLLASGARAEKALILVGSSMGGYVAAAASAALQPTGLFLLAPALYMPDYPLPAPEPHASLVTIVHGWRDDVIPVENSFRYARIFAARLFLLPDDHRLVGDLPLLVELFQAFLRSAAAAGNVRANAAQVRGFSRGNDPRAGFSGLDTPRLLVRRLQLADAQALSAYRSDPEVARFQSWTGFSSEKARQFIHSLADSTPGTPGEWFQFALQEKSSGALVGDIGLRTAADDPALGEIGYTLARPYQGRGYAREAVRAVLAYCFEALELHRVIAVTDTRNHPSIRLLERLGFRREAHFVQSYREGNNWTDEYLYAMLRAEWEQDEA
jgi:RimJ/RimL family protein N-acetyltransferase